VIEHEKKRHAIECSTICHKLRLILLTVVAIY